MHGAMLAEAGGEELARTTERAEGRGERVQLRLLAVRAGWCVVGLSSA